MARKRFAGLMLLSWFVPVIGGLIAYFLKKETNKPLANVLLAGSFVVPVQFAGALVAAVVGGPYIVFSVPFAIAAAYGLIRLWPDNPYRHVLWAFYLGIIGAIYAYYWPYKEDDVVRSSVGWFAVGWVLIYLVVGTLVGALASYLWMQNMQAQMAGAQFS